MPKQQSRFADSLSNSPDIFRWGPIPLDVREVVNHFAAVGTTGSGKTTILRLLMQDVMLHRRSNKDCRVMIYDAKQDALPIVKGICSEARVFTLHPFDARGVAWDICRDLTEPRVVLEVAHTLIPSIHESQPFFSDASRSLVYGVMLSFMLRGMTWDLADVIRATWSQRRLRNVLRACPETKRFAMLYFGDRKLMSNILTTIATKMQQFEPLAACWSRAETKISLEDWVRGNDVLILGNTETSRYAIDCINRCVFKRISDLTLNLSESRTRRTFIFLDELSEAGGKLPGLIALAKKGRSKGTCLVLAMQNLTGLHHAESYGEHLTADLLGQIGHRFIGRCECPQTAEWASKLFGDQEIQRITWSNTYADKVSLSYTESIVTQNVALASEFLSIPSCTLENGLTGYYLSRVTGAFHANLPGRDLFQRDLMPLSNDPEFVPRDPECQILHDWTPEQEALFAPSPPKNPDRTPSSQQSFFDHLGDL